MAGEVLLTVDLVAIARDDEGLRVLLVRRGRPPYAGSWALPGGFVEDDEDLAAAARRELAEETGLDLTGVDVVQVGAYGAPGRDPRGRVVSVAYAAVVDAGAVEGADDADEAAWVRLPVTEELAFDHERILADALERLRLG